MATGDVFAVKLQMTFAGQKCLPGFYLIEGTGTGGTDPVQDCADRVTAVILDGVGLTGLSAALSLTGVQAQDVQPGTSRSRATVVVGQVGDIADDNPVAPQDSMLIEWTGSLKGGKGKFARRSRTYLPGIYSTGQISGFLIPDLQDALSAFASQFFDAFVTDGTDYQMHNVAFNPGTNPRTVKEVNPVTAFAVDNVVAIQRSRRPGRGI